MQHKRFVVGLSLIIAIMVCSVGQVSAKTGSSGVQSHKKDGDPVNNRHLKRSLTFHSQRVAAADRLKVKYEGIRAEEIAQEVRDHGHGHKRSAK